METKAGQNWSRKLARKSEGTRRSYTSHMAGFLAVYGLDCEGLYQRIMESRRNGEARDQTEVEDMVLNHALWLHRSGYSAQTIKMFVAAVRSFAKSNSVELYLDRDDFPKGEGLGSRIVVAEEILALYRHIPWTNKLRNQALILFQKDSGLRVGDSCALNVGDFRGARVVERAEGRFACFSPRLTQKRGVAAYIIIGDEAIDALNEYLGERDSPSDEEPLFVQDSGRITADVGGGVVRRLKHKIMNGDRVSIHSLRKFHYSMLEISKVPKNIIGKLEGKKISDSTAAYSRPEDIPGALLNAYASAYGNLRIFTKVGADEVEELRTHIAEAEAERDVLRKQMAMIERQLNQQNIWRAMSGEMNTDFVEIEPGTWVHKDRVEGWRKR